MHLLAKLPLVNWGIRSLTLSNYICFIHFSFNVKYICGSVGWRAFLFGEKTVKFKCDWGTSRYVQKYVLPAPVPPWKLSGSFIVSSLMAGRLDYSSVLRHQTPLEETRLQTTDLSNNVLDFFFKYTAGTYMSWAWVWLTSLSLSSSKFSCGLVQLVLSSCSLSVSFHSH